MASPTCAPPSTIECGSKRLLTRLEIMAVLGISKDLLISLLRDPRDPMPVLMLGGVYRFNLHDVMRWAARRTRRVGGDVVRRRRRAGLASWAARKPRAEKTARLPGRGGGP